MFYFATQLSCRNEQLKGKIIKVFVRYSCVIILILLISFFQNVKSDLIKLIASIGFNISNLNQAKGTVPKPDYSEGDILEISKYISAKTLDSRTIAKIKAVLLAGLYPNIAKVSHTPQVDAAVNTEQTVCVGETTQGPVHAHPSSVNRYLQANGWLVYHQKV